MAGTTITLEDAINQRFEQSTRDELLTYCEELGITDVRPNAELSDIKSRIYGALGIADRQSAPSGQGVGRVFKSNVLPEMNLTPSGKWGGRRRRIVVPRPASATKSERAMPIGWNGKATYWLPYNEPVAVPYPIYNILKQLTIRRPIQKTVDGPGETKEITTAWEFDPFPMTDFGDDPSTAHLPCSLTEWYQEKGPDFFKKLSERDLTLICTRLDVQVMGKDNKRLPAAELVDSVLIFLYGVSAESMVEEGAETTT